MAQTQRDPKQRQSWKKTVGSRRKFFLGSSSLFINCPFNLKKSSFFVFPIRLPLLNTSFVPLLLFLFSLLLSYVRHMLDFLTISCSITMLLAQRIVCWAREEGLRARWQVCRQGEGELRSQHPGRLHLPLLAVQRLRNSCTNSSPCSNYQFCVAGKTIFEFPYQVKRTSYMVRQFVFINTKYFYLINAFGTVK